LDVDSVLNKIDYEREQTVELRTRLLSQRERAIGSTNTAILTIGAGLGVISSIGGAHAILRRYAAMNRCQDIRPAFDVLF